MFAQSKPLPGTPLNWADSITSGLLGYWAFLEGAGSRVQNCAGPSNVGTLTNIAQSATSGWIGGRAGGQAIAFDGTNDYIITSRVINITRVTIAAWIKVAAFPVTNHGAIAGFMDGYNNATNDKGLTLRTDGKVYFYAYAGGGITTSAPSNAISLNVWTHVVGTADGVTMKAYVNGVMVGSVACGLTYAAYTVPNFLIQGSSNSASWINMGTHQPIIIDGVQLWNRALLDHEIRQLYAQPFCLFAPPRVPGWFVPAATFKPAWAVGASQLVSGGCGS